MNSLITEPPKLKWEGNIIHNHIDYYSLWSHKYHLDPYIFLAHQGDNTSPHKLIT